MSFLRRFSLLVALMACFMSATALDLPVKTLGQTRYYYYKVKKNETVYGISKKLGLTRDEIVRHNPVAEDGVKKGMELYFPYDEYSPAAIAEAVVEEVAPEQPEIAPKRPAIVVMMPFGLANAEPSRRNKLALDFYRGFLMRTQDMARISNHVEIEAVDTDVDAAALRAALASESVATAAVIVAPDDDSTYRTIADSAAVHGTYVLNTLLFADSLYLSNPYVLQANIPHRAMYSLAVDAIEADFDGFTPVILRSRSGRADKEAFVAYLVDRFRRRGVEPLEISYENNLVIAELDALPADAGQKYLMIPASGSLAEFNKFAYVLKSFRDRLAAAPAVDDDGNLLPRARVELFGYPDWTIFRGDALDALHKLEATIYSRFCDNFSGSDYRTFAADYRRWYGASPIESVPSYALLGFDTAGFLINNLNSRSAGTFDPLSPPRFRGVQSTLQFEKTDEGYCNSVLYIIRYQPDGTISSRVI